MMITKTCSNRTKERLQEKDEKARELEGRIFPPTLTPHICFSLRLRGLSFQSSDTGHGAERPRRNLSH